jgi:hypothetical protein
MWGYAGSTFTLRINPPVGLGRIRSTMRERDGFHSSPKELSVIH